MALHFLIDGYNAIHKIFPCCGKNLREERERLIQIVIKFRLAGSHRNKVTIVFDGMAEINYSNSAIKVVFSHSETADSKIRNMVEKAENPKEIVVVTDDREIKYYTRALGAKVAGIEEFFSKIFKEKRKISNDKPGEFDDVAVGITEDMKKIWLKNKA